MADVAGAMAECRETLQKRRRSWLRKLGLKPLPHGEAAAGSEPVERLRAALVREGGVHWSAVAMANVGIFEPGVEDLPGIVVVEGEATVVDVVLHRVLVRRPSGRKLPGSAKTVASPFALE